MQSFFFCWGSTSRRWSFSQTSYNKHLNLKLGNNATFASNTILMITSQISRSVIQSWPRQQAYTGTQGYNSNQLLAYLFNHFTFKYTHTFIYIYTSFFLTVPFSSDLKRKQHANRKKSRLFSKCNKTIPSRVGAHPEEKAAHQNFSLITVRAIFID